MSLAFIVPPCDEAEKDWNNHPINLNLVIKFYPLDHTSLFLIVFWFGGHDSVTWTYPRKEDRDKHLKEIIEKRCLILGTPIPPRWLPIQDGQE